MCTAFDFISSKLDEVLSINPSASVFAFRDLMFIIRPGLPIMVELTHLVNSAIILLSQMTLLRWLTFLLGSQTDSHSPALLDFFLSSDASICSAMAFLLFGDSDHVVIPVSIDFPSHSQ